MPSISPLLDGAELNFFKHYCMILLGTRYSYTVWVDKGRTRASSKVWVSETGVSV
jgi:hypothetical protein